MDEAATLDTIHAIDRTLCALRNSGINNQTIIGVLAGLLFRAIDIEPPEYQVAIRRSLGIGGPA